MMSVSTNASTNAPSPVSEPAKPSDYDTWAWLYNQTVGPEYSEAQWRFLQLFLLPAVPQEARLLDLCCGTGQLIRPLLAAGYKVIGLDNSEAMLACARHNAPKADYLLGDARNFWVSAPCDGVYSTSASLNHMASLEELGQVFEQVNHTLRPGGVFVFDLNHHQQMARWWRGLPYEGGLTEDFAWLITPDYNPEQRRGAFTLTLYRPPAGRRPNAFKCALYRLLNQPRFIGIRLHALRHFRWLEPDWEQHKTAYPVTGHDLVAVSQRLRDSGFERIRITTINGSGIIDDRHSAHFVCRKKNPADNSRAPEVS